MDASTNWPAWAAVGPRAETLGGDGRILAGAAAAVAVTIGADALVVRLAFVTLATAGGWGVVAYLAVWAWFAFVRPHEPLHGPPVTRHHDLGVAVLTAGLLLAAREVGVGFSDAVVWPVALISVGVGVAWRRIGVDDALATADGEVIPTARTTRVGLGIVLLVIGSLSLVGTDLSFSAWIRLLLGLAVVAAGVAVALGPTIHALGSALVEERRRRIRADERAVISAHLHDSVLQTLALIQRRAADPAAVAALARTQERELRRWLFDGSPAPSGTVRAAVEEVTDEIEGLHHLVVDAVVVGDRPLDPPADAMVAAVREALVNVAKFAGVDRASVFVEVSSAGADAFVRDRGVGFDRAGVPTDRRGLSDSIEARMTRIGGRAVITSEPGEGTEVHLWIPPGGDT